jgi:hypothetical protein
MPRSGRRCIWWASAPCLNMRKVCLLFVLAVIIGPPAMADSFDGWCFPADGCTSEPMPIKNGTFATCEESCEMTNPAKFDGLDATAYDVICKGDHLPEPSKERMIFVRFSGDRNKAAVVDVAGITELIRCK